jgi:hypothetical protein
MEGGGSYNRHAKLPAAGAHLALPLLDKAAQDIDLACNDQPVVIADYGSSQGKNSLAPMRSAIRALRSRLGPERSILVVHIDQAGNDFNTLFDVLHSDPERYSADDPKVFPCAIGRSFYENVFPPGQVDLGWSSYAAVWLSRVPARIPGHFIALGSNGEARAAFDRQAAEDWKKFLSLRASELRPGGRLVIVLPGITPEGNVGLEHVFNQANESLAEMVQARRITPDERARMVLAAYARCESQLREPFRADGQFESLSVEHCELLALPDVAWEEYERDNNVEVLASRHALFFRSIFVPSLASALDNAGDPIVRSSFADCVEQTLTRRLMERPTPLHSFVQTMVLAKQGSSPPARSSNRNACLHD